MSATVIKLLFVRTTGKKAQQNQQLKTGLDSDKNASPPSRAAP
jgi:hypothetical protein